MKSEFKDRWIAALRSGEYKQGRGALRKENGEPRFCCLGVLCDIADPDGWVMEDPDDPDAKIAKFMYDGYGKYTASYLPCVLANSLKMPNDSVVKLVAMNDSERASFKTIANWIEKNL